jgi:hypothetical protein
MPDVIRMALVWGAELLRLILILLGLMMALGVFYITAGSTG